MEPVEVLRKIKNRERLDHRAIRYAVRLHSLVSVTNEKGETVNTYDQALEAKTLSYSLTRRGSKLVDEEA